MAGGGARGAGQGRRGAAPPAAHTLFQSGPCVACASCSARRRAGGRSLPPLRAAGRVGAQEQLRNAPSAPRSLRGGPAGARAHRAAAGPGRAGAGAAAVHGGARAPRLPLSAVVQKASYLRPKNLPRLLSMPSAAARPGRAALRVFGPPALGGEGGRGGAAGGRGGAGSGRPRWGPAAGQAGSGWQEGAGSASGAGPRAGAGPARPRALRRSGRAARPPRRGGRGRGARGRGLLAPGPTGGRAGSCARLDVGGVVAARGAGARAGRARPRDLRRSGRAPASTWGAWPRGAGAWPDGGRGLRGAGPCGGRTGPRARLDVGGRGRRRARGRTPAGQRLGSGPRRPAPVARHPDGSGARSPSGPGQPAEGQRRGQVEPPPSHVPASPAAAAKTRSRSAHPLGGRPGGGGRGGARARPPAPGPQLPPRRASLFLLSARLPRTGAGRRGRAPGKSLGSKGTGLSVVVLLGGAGTAGIAR
ncbi:collagen alpha-1(I) chain-like [Dama dama]|uniref:collagen alpha-1(I) chain-like n=1 Tax=Dama dama TaxID=30532 RepID=UPI002A370200|nr:collagen alpha-1(I) chain-like [Dama dama]